MVEEPFYIWNNGASINIVRICILASEHLGIVFLNGQKELLHMVRTMETIEDRDHWLAL